ncbi:SPOR domain-containing protein [Stappia indica]|uniref:SPOR domain-containing protein n=1 Tax=Stappia indica TaxID=538381 RepID=UPI001CD2B2B5|nr:SPOR domain-containing protein [Stappia indica]MCA1296908.1 SPOR domain-containing protein [Stappia indica]
MPNRSNFSVNGGDNRDGRQRADDDFAPFEEDPLVELARIVSEGNAQFQSVTPSHGAEPIGEEPYPLQDETSRDPYAVEPDPYAPVEAGGAYHEAPVGDDWVEGELPAADVDPYAPRAYAEDSYAAEPQGYAAAPQVYAEEPYAEEAPQHVDPYQVDPYAPVDPYAAAAPRDEDIYAQDAYGDPVVPVERAPEVGGAQPDAHWSGDAIWEAEAHLGDQLQALESEPEVAADPVRQPSGLSDDLSASLEDGLMSALYVNTGQRAAEFEPEPEPFDGDRLDDIFLEEPELPGDHPGQSEAESSDWGAGAAVGVAGVAAATQGRAPAPRAFDHLRAAEPAPREAAYFDPDSEAPPPPEGYDLDAVAQAMREGDPQLGGHGVLPPHSATEQAAVPEKTSRRGLYAAAAVLGVVVVGGGAFTLLNIGGDDALSGPPPVIAAQTGPMKTFPEPESPASAGQSKLIYDRVGGIETPRGEQLLETEETPVASLPPAPTATGSQSGDVEVPSGPRRVRTVVVSPDGTIISADEPTARPATTTPATSRGGVDEPTRVATRPIILPGAGAPAPVSGEPSGAAGTATPAPMPAETTTAPTATAEAGGAAQPAPGNVPRGKPIDIERIAAAATPPPATRQVASAPSTSGTAPMDLTASGGAARPAAPAATASGSIPAGAYVVQVSSQRSQAQAQTAFDDLQRRYGSVLGGVTPVIEKADLGDRGTFYRVRIPAGSRDDAISLCERLKAAGGDCFVRRN